MQDENPSCVHYSGRRVAGVLDGYGGRPEEVRMVTGVVWLGLYHYYIEQIGELEKGRMKRAVVWGLTLAALLPGAASAVPVTAGGGYGGAWIRLVGWLAITAVFLLYVLFYDGKPFRDQWRRVLFPGLGLALSALAEGAASVVFLNGAVAAAFLLLLRYCRGCLDIGNSLLTIAVYALPCFWLWNSGAAAGKGLTAGVWVLELLLFFTLEGTLSSYHRGYENRTEQFQRDVLNHQYQEIKGIYLDMRGWRHDYHNHLQVMKAQLMAGRTEEMKQYLDELERNLDNVDTYVKSGNLMADAILNSKLTLAEQRRIRVNCKALLPDTLSVADVDLCVILGNLLDNALEACEKIPEGGRFLRVYMVVNRSQLYISIQNSAKEELDFNERNYITQKRGSHGLGMKRVKALVDKYEGYLTLANEPGIFAAEVTLPLRIRNI